MKLKKIYPILILIIITGCSRSQPEAESRRSEDVNPYKSDFIEAAEEIADNYIYFERKVKMSRSRFLDACQKYADEVVWDGGKGQFVEEIRSLCANFPDSHISWKLSKEFAPEPISYLGFILTVNPDEEIYVGRASSERAEKAGIAVGDRLIEWNGMDSHIVLERLAALYPRSSRGTTLEIAARHMPVHYPRRPLRERLQSVEAIFEREDGTRYRVTLNWEPVEVETDWRHRDGKTLWLQKNGFPSLEEIPIDAEYVHRSLPYYFRSIKGRKCIILHPRDFYHWSLHDLELTFKRFLGLEDKLLVIDLKDSAGGAFNQVLYLSHMLGMDETFRYFYDVIDSEKETRMSGVGDFAFISDEIEISRVWRGDVVLRIGNLTASGGDFFSRWFQLNERGVLIGEPTAGAGGGTDDFILSETSTVLSLPLRERIIVNDDQSLEGNPVLPDHTLSGSCEGDIAKLLERL